MSNTEFFINLFQDSLWIILLIVSVIIIPSLLIGLIVAIFQAATSINEQTLSFLPRLIITLAVLILCSHWIVELLMDFFSILLTNSHMCYTKN
ncbi:flagellar biosynthesis pathway, component FliQ [Candidatus Photodesmus katoptron Akat1]|uniref:Flagellar biosynthetic protein FliQ n=1 Tax=Candidatus Photodesmus katoptron Akat1 TaxID=1236703 RepID=S3DJM5_9GAMM|nr:flagellar biosynthesis pathway, component FliQ [Candidatus Photodesmus katoptron Akat1]